MLNRLTGSLTVDTQLSCTTNCTLSADCDSYNYRPADNSCQLNTHATPMVANSADLVSDADWQWWSNTFTIVK